ncbi:MAG: RluA family pseudouridine synthase [Lachnospiraceae bacterium]|nr:RluA family pseudouridine synthase [Lachnospiraceae bacterium]
MQEIKIGPNHAGQRLDKFLHKYLPNAGSGILYKMLRKKNITLNGKKAEGKEILQINDKVQSYFSDETFAKFSGKIPEKSEAEGKQAQKLLSNNYEQAFKSPDMQGVTVLYEDEHVLILNKPVGVLTQKAKDSDISLNEWMIGYLLDKNVLTSNELELFKPSVVNRLDRNTSGIVLCGISLKGSQILSRLIKERIIGKFYRTICVGHVKEANVLKGSLKKNELTNVVTVDGGGQVIETAYVPITSLKGNMTYLEVELITGKTHQIRAHLASIQHPLIGDTKYGNDKYNQKVRKKYGLKNQLLHAYRMEFPLIEGELSGLSERIIIAPLPEQFIRILEDIR